GVEEPHPRVRLSDDLRTQGPDHDGNRRSRQARHERRRLLASAAKHRAQGAGLFGRLRGAGDCSSCRLQNDRAGKVARVLASADKIRTAAEIMARARALIPAWRQRAPQGERERRLPKETIADMQAAGLFKVLQPKRWGGYELDIHTYFDTQIALGEGDMSPA